jgi:hypothetical protein
MFPLHSSRALALRAKSQIYNNSDFELARAYRERFRRAERPAGLIDIARELAIKVGLP